MLFTSGTVFSTTISAAQSKKNVHQSGVYQYTLNKKGEATIVLFDETKATAKESKHIVVPKRIDGHLVRAIGKDAFYKQGGTKSIMLPNSIRKIGYSAFDGCTNLKSINIPNGVKVLNSYTFGDCISLRKIQLPKSITTIKKDAFYGTGISEIFIPKNVKKISYRAFNQNARLKKITVSKKNKKYCAVDFVLFNIDKTVLVRYPNGKGTEYSIPEGTKTIGAYAFSGCNITKIVVPKSVTKIEKYAFGWCDSLKEFIYQNINIMVHNSAFQYCLDDLVFKKQQ